MELSLSVGQSSRMSCLLNRPKKGPHSFEWGLLVAEGGFEPPTSGLSLRASCGARKNLRAIRPLDFFDRCANALLAVSAAGGARGRFPMSHARRSHNPEL